MNRIILIGNGFDLAHGLDTCYKDFLDDYWKNTTKAIHENKIGNIKELSVNLTNQLDNNILDIRQSPAYRFISFKNLFLKHITDKSSLENWVDIENEYYRLLKESYKSTSLPGKLGDIEKLNFDFEQVQKLLIKYLINEVDNFRKNLPDSRLEESVRSKIYAEFKLRDFTEDFLNQKAIIEFKSLREDTKPLEQGLISFDDLNDVKQKMITSLGKDKSIKRIRELFVSDHANDIFYLKPNNILFLNFNYTPTEFLYMDKERFPSSRFNRYNDIKTQSIHIHGDIKDDDSIIFGFGDELDDEYKSLEKLNDNRYLENIKSIKYLEKDNYKRLLQFINSEEYQIFIFGHSCGISDRTLLNTLFEHKNCVSIKPFYHKKKDETDNYSDITKNISRNFNDKISMRDKVVNKEYCELITW